MGAEQVPAGVFVLGARTWDSLGALNWFPFNIRLLITHDKQEWEKQRSDYHRSYSQNMHMAPIFDYCNKEASVCNQLGICMTS